MFFTTPLSIRLSNDNYSGRFFNAIMKAEKEQGKMEYMYVYFMNDDEGDGNNLVNWQLSFNVLYYYIFSCR